MHSLSHNKTINIVCVINAAIHAIQHCIITTPTAYLPPSSLFIDAIAAIHGVYNRQNTRNASTPAGATASIISTVLPKRIDIVDTTLSFAITPVRTAVAILQSPKPSGLNIGDIQLAIAASILSLESVTTLSLISKFCKNHIRIVAINIIEKAFCKKSFAFSHSNCITFLAPGIL